MRWRPRLVGERRRRLSIDWIAALAAVAIICVISLVRSVSTPPWIDETYTVAAVQNLSESLGSTHFTMSGYYVVLWLWSAASTSIVWLRMFSLLCAIGAILCVRKLAMVIGGRSLAATAVIILPFLAMFQWKASEARAYGLEILVVCVCWLIVVTGRLYGARHTTRWWVMLGLLGAYGESLHGLFFLQYLPIATYLVLADRRWRTVVRAAGLLAVPVVVAGLLWSEGASGVGTYMGGGPRAWIGSYVHTFFGSHNALVVCLFGGSVVWLVLLIRSTRAPTTAAPTPTRWTGSLWTFVPMAGLTVLSVVVDRYNPRYLAPILPGLALLLAQVAVSLNHLTARTVRQRFTRSAMARNPTVHVVGSAVIIALTILGSIATPRFIDSPWRQIVSRVAADHGPHDCIIFAEISHDFPAQVRTPFEVTWGEYESGRHLRVISSNRGLGKARRFDTALRPGEVALRARRCDSVWLLSATGYGVDPTSRYLRTPVLQDDFRQDGSWHWDLGYTLTLLQRR